jgi:hypothetical protein
LLECVRQEWIYRALCCFALLCGKKDKVARPYGSVHGLWLNQRCQAFGTNGWVHALHCCPPTTYLSRWVPDRADASNRVPSLPATGESGTRGIPMFSGCGRGEWKGERPLPRWRLDCADKYHAMQSMQI